MKNSIGIKLAAAVTMVGAVMSLAGCSHDDTGKPTPSQRQVFGGLPDPAAKARDAALQADPKNRPPAPGYGAPAGPPPVH